jgi:DNA (cytosine-5)-methyltransferase 1
MARIIGEIQPRYIFVENSPILTIRGLNRVLGDITEMGYDARWGVISAGACGAPHRRERIWIFANAKSLCIQTKEILYKKECYGEFRRTSFSPKIPTSFWKVNQPRMDGMANGMADWVGRSKAIGNGQVPIVAATAFKILTNNKTQKCKQ